MSLSFQTIRSGCVSQLVAIDPNKKVFFTELEARVFDLCGKPQNISQAHAYKRKMVQLLYNLGKFCNYLLENYTPSELVHLGGKELNPDVKINLEAQKRHADEYEKIKALIIDDPNATVDDEDDEEGILKCGKCGNTKNIPSIMRQLRSGDEPMTLFAKCKCGNQWRQG